MALPRALDASFAWDQSFSSLAFLGPFFHGGRVYYISGHDFSDDAGGPMVWSSPDPSATAFTEDDSGNAPAGTNSADINSIDAFYDGRYIGILSVQSAGAGIWDIEFHKFDCDGAGNGTWAEINVNIANDVEVGVGSVVAKSDGWWVIGYPSAPEKIHGTNYARTSLAKRDGESGAFTTGLSPHDGGQTQYSQIQLLPASSASNSIHFLLFVTGSGWEARTYRLDVDTMSTSVLLADTSLNRTPRRGLAADDGGTWRVHFLLIATLADEATIFGLVEDASDDVTATGAVADTTWTTYSDTSGAHVFLDSVAGIEYLVVADGTLDVGVATRTWGTASLTEQMPLDSDRNIQWGTSYRIGAYVGDHGGGKVLGIITTDQTLSAWVYNEVLDLSASNSGVGSSTSILTVSAVGASTHAAGGSSASALSVSGAGRAVTKGVGLATMALAASAVGVAIIAGAGSSAASLTTTGVGRAIFKAAGVSTPALTVAGVGRSTSSAAGVSTPALTAAGVGRSIFKADGVSTPALTVAGVGRSIFKADGVSTPALTVAGVGRSIFKADGVSTPALTVLGVGNAITSGSAGSSVSDLTVIGVGRAIFKADGVSTPALTVAGVGRSIFKTDGVSTPALTVAGVGRAIFKADGVSTPALTVAGVGRSIFKADGVSTPALTVAGVGRAIFRSAGISTQLLTVDGVGNAVTSGSAGNSVSDLTVIGVGRSIFKADGVSTPALTVAGVGRSIFKADGSIVATLTSIGVGRSIFKADGSIVATLTTTGVGRSIFKADGVSTPALSVVGVGRSTHRAVGTSTALLSVFGRGGTIAVIGPDGSGVRLGVDRERIYSTLPVITLISGSPTISIEIQSSIPIIVEVYGGVEI